MKQIIDKKGIKYFLFDVDGVIVDSEKIFNRCWLEGAKSVGYNLTFEQALQLRSLNSKMANALFVELFNDETAYQKVRTARKEIMAEVMKHEPLELKPGIIEALDKLDDEGINYAVVSSSPVNRCQDYMKRVGLGGRFKTFISGEMVNNGKPYPDIYLLACETLGVQPDECIAIEDSPNGVKSAKAAGCRTLMIPDLSPYSVELAEFVDYVFEKVDDINFE